MNPRLARKAIYVALMVVLVVPLAALSLPATIDQSGQLRSGGKLAQLRAEYRLSQVNLGEIDPASATMRLASLGMSNIGANLLWGQANHYKKVEDWTNFRATLDQIIRLQPNFTSVWRFQAWNLSYNVSAEFDDYKDRYYWVKEGIKYLFRGNEYNADNPRLLWDTGWFISQKIGRSDERKQFRRLYRRDEEFATYPWYQGDNWLDGRTWFLKAQEAVRKINSYRGMNPLIFHSDPVMALINHASNLNEDGIYGDVGKSAWQRASDEWFRYGQMLMPTTYGFKIRLGELEDTEARIEKLEQQLEDLAPGVRDRLVAEKRAGLTEEELQIVDLPYEQRTPDQMSLASDLEQKIHVGHLDVAKEASEENRVDALRVADELNFAQEYARVIQQYRTHVNFAYWRTRAEMEKTDDAVLARSLVYEGAKKLAEADLVGAKESYTEGLKYWRKVLDKYPSLLDDSVTGDELVQIVRKYGEILEQNEEAFPEDFILQDVLDLYGGQKQ